MLPTKLALALRTVPELFYGAGAWAAIAAVEADTDFALETTEEYFAKSASAAGFGARQGWAWAGCASVEGVNTTSYGVPGWEPRILPRIIPFVLETARRAERDKTFPGHVLVRHSAALHIDPVQALRYSVASGMRVDAMDPSQRVTHEAQLAEACRTIACAPSIVDSAPAVTDETAREQPPSEHLLKPSGGGALPYPDSVGTQSSEETPPLEASSSPWFTRPTRKGTNPFPESGNFDTSLGTMRRLLVALHNLDTEDADPAAAQQPPMAGTSEDVHPRPAMNITPAAETDNPDDRPTMEMPTIGKKGAKRVAYDNPQIVQPEHHTDAAPDVPDIEVDNEDTLAFGGWARNLLSWAKGTRGRKPGRHA